MVDRTPGLTEAEMVGILEGLARDSTSATAQIAAIKLLRAIRLERDGKEPSGGFAELLEMEPRRSTPGGWRP